ncbi:glycosyltransferase [uncultured Olleya sp.]|uniref:glycosyltransferase n=1 Tax=uncultured Olleya sp. TaxID=757243 RepID=UPI0025962403|nr:glycosyltransferase [uncultured Olleya sp.]
MKTDSPLISIILPCYNVQSFLETALTSVLNQNYTNWECILVDDGSQDNTASIISNWLNTDKRFKSIFQENKGLSGARNTGLKKAIGDYIYFFDPDDLIADNTLQDLLNLALTNPNVHIVIGKNAIVEGQNKVIKSYLTHNDKVEEEILNQNKQLLKLAIEKDIICVAWNKLYRKTFLDKNNLEFKKGILHEDELWFFETLYYAQSVIFNTHATYFYNVANANSITSKFKVKNLISYLTIVTIVYNKYLNKITNKQDQQMVGNYFVHLKIKTIVHCYKQLSKQGKKATKNEILSTFNSLENTLNNPELLSNDHKQLHKKFKIISVLGLDNQLKYLRYFQSKKLGRRIKKNLLYNLAKFKS